jgi:NADH dehydrogenase (ubiquinone) 1 alpha/beta subcomplex 1
MFRSAVLRSLRASAPRVAIKTPAPFQIRSSPIAARVPQFTPCYVSQSIRAYSAPAGLNKNEVEGRIVNLLKNFDKVRQNSCPSPGRFASPPEIR